MKQDRQRKLIDRIVGHLESGVDPMAETVMVQPTAPYIEVDHFDRERALFRSLPVVVGSSDRVRAAGDFFTDDLTGWPLLIVRGDDGVLRGFHNSCGHRGAQVESGSAGCKRRFICPYHAWSYDNRGGLVAIPNDAGFEGLDRSTRGLVQIPVEERHGLVWAKPASGPDETVEVAAFLGTLDAELAEFEMHDFHHDRVDVLREPFNWKQVVDGFLETYHLRFLHRKTVAPYIRSNFALFDAYGPHGRTIGLRDSFEPMLGGPVEEQELLPHVVVIYQIFPNNILVWQGDHFEAWSSFPAGDASSMVARASLLAPPDKAGPAYRERWDKNWEILMGTVRNEDFVVARAIYQNFLARTRKETIFGRQEAPLQHFHSALAERTSR